MEQYDNTNKGVLFKAEEKIEDWHDDYKGTIDIEGKEYWIGAAVRESKRGQKYMKLNVREKVNKSDDLKQELEPRNEYKAAKVDYSADFTDDTIPF